MFDLDWIEEQMAPLVESMEARKVRTYEDILCDAQEEAADLNWIHYLGKTLRCACARGLYLSQFG